MRPGEKATRGDLRQVFEEDCPFRYTIGVMFQRKFVVSLAQNTDDTLPGFYLLAVCFRYTARLSVSRNNERQEYKHPKENESKIRLRAHSDHKWARRTSKHFNMQMSMVFEDALTHIIMINRIGRCVPVQ